MKQTFRGANQNVKLLRAFFCCSLSVLTLLAFALIGSRAAELNPGANEIRILWVQGSVEVMPDGAKRWMRTQSGDTLYPGDKLRTGTNSHARLLWSPQSVTDIGALTVIEIKPPKKSDSLPGMLLKGLISFFHRNKPGQIEIFTRGSTAGVKGTEFVMEVTDANDGERVNLAVIDGEVELSNARGETLVLTNLQRGIIEPGQAPTRAPGFDANNVLQWCFYYPGVLDPSDLSLTTTETRELEASLDAYRKGDLVNALAKYPAARGAVSDSERIYHASLLLSVGQVEQTQDELEKLHPDAQNGRLAGALRTLIAAVKRSSRPPALSPRLATELLAESYYQQSLANDEESLKTALQFARYATIVSPEFGFAWERVAELEFSFGRIDESLQALDRSIELSPTNAQAMALKGFLLAANNKIVEAKKQFDLAIATDGALGNAWLGRGLCRIRQGDTKGGQEDLLVAAASEPQRSLLRSYLGKAYAKIGDLKAARHELELAKQLDRKDPTPWLYSALLNDQYNRFNEGISDLEESQRLNDNRRLFRSRLLLDQDEAVRSSTLAELYQDAGMPEVAVREAARAVTYDYANYSAHLFLADGFNSLRDPTRFNLRYETPWFNELLLANLLSPVGGTPLSQNISQQEYSRLFDQDKVGLASSTTYRSDGQIYELASQYGNIGNTAWALDLDYQHNDGVRPNNELDRLEWYTTFKQQLTPQDSVMLLTKYQDYHSGDNFQYYEPTNARPNFSFDESQSPIVLGGYHHEWQPGIHTLVLGGRLENAQQFSDLNTSQIVLSWDDPPPPAPQSSFPIELDVEQSTDLEIYTVEVQQILESERNTLLLGGRWQGGQFDTHSLMTDPSFGIGFTNPAADLHAVDDFERVSLYAYETLKLGGGLNLTGGLTYDYMRYPENFRAPPIQSGEETRERLNPKAALVWNALPQVTLRAVYAQSLGGVSLDESYRLEPAQLAGFAQGFRTLIPESLVGSVSAPDHTIAGAALDLKFSTGTYIGLQVENLRSDVNRSVGVFDFFVQDLVAIPSSTRQNLDYEQSMLRATLNQLVGERWVFGAQYSFTHADLETTYPDLTTLPSSPDLDLYADLQLINLFAIYNHPSGFFSRVGWDWYIQTDSRAQVSPTVVADVPNESFNQLNLFAGYRFPRQRGDLTLGVLNLTGQDYRLNPVTPYLELPRERTFYVRFSFRF